MRLNTCMVGDNRDVLPTLESGSVQTCVTSPPYWGLRDYGTAKWEGGDDGCDHVAPPTGGRTGSTLKGSDQRGTWSADGQYRQECAKCGSRRVDAQLGLEKTPEEYVANMVQVFREVKRVLRDDGTLWLNLGDSYVSNPMQDGRSGHSAIVGNTKSGIQKNVSRVAGLKQKDLVGIPWRVAFALQADGWYLRQDIIWSKPNPMPESVTDRCTKAHEYIFLLSKSARYYFDAEAIAEPASYAMYAQLEQGYEGEATKDYDAAGVQDPSAVKKRILAKHKNMMDKGLKPQGMHVRRSVERGGFDGKTGDAAFRAFTVNRNKRSVWTVTTKPFSGAHFATFPPDLIDPCILAGSKPGDTVLDPFGGSGTTGMVAEKLGRNWILIELNPAYEKLSRERTAQQGLVLA